MKTENETNDFFWDGFWYKLALNNKDNKYFLKLAIEYDCSDITLINLEVY